MTNIPPIQSHVRLADNVLFGALGSTETVLDGTGGSLSLVTLSEVWSPESRQQ